MSTSLRPYHSLLLAVIGVLLAINLIRSPSDPSTVNAAGNYHILRTDPTVGDGSLSTSSGEVVGLSCPTEHTCFVLVGSVVH
jgi:hypothetical protein